MSNRKGSHIEGLGHSKSKRNRSSTSSLLPDPSSHIEIKSISKTVKKAFASLKDIDLLDPELATVTRKLNEDQKVCWMIQRFGWSTITTIASKLNSLPASLTCQQRLLFMQSECSSCNIQFDDSALEIVVEFLSEECTSFVSSFPEELLVLSPPLSECPCCDSRLVSYHQCSVKLYGCAS